MIPAPLVVSVLPTSVRPEPTIIDWKKPLTLAPASVWVVEERPVMAAFANDAWPEKVEVPEEVTARVPVVVAPPEMVRPPTCVPLPMVVEASDKIPPEKVRSVEVALLGKRYPMVLVKTPVPEL